MDYRSTRDAGKSYTASGAILEGLSPDGGLFVPSHFPQIDFSLWQNKNYPELAQLVLAPFLNEYSADFLEQATHQSYDEPFDKKPLRLQKVRNGVYSLELWHGPTAAFKDYALQLMPKLLYQAKQINADKKEEETLVLVATSGDTGKAALEGFKDIEGIKIAALYPLDGTSEVQRLQMVTQEGNNVTVFAIHGNFDDAQRAVKKVFANKELGKSLKGQNKSLSSANSINWGRLVPQIVYYVASYLQFCKQGDIEYGQAVDYCVPTGNFGDILAGYYAKKMGLPIGRLICASNSNNVLADFFATGTYDARREFYKTSSPSMDILISSNLERLLYHASGSDKAVRGWMEQLAKDGFYTVDKATLAEIQGTFEAGWLDEKKVSDVIFDIFEQDAYLCDPHTAVGFGVAQNLPPRQNPLVVLSTASPYKFSGKVLEALRQETAEDEFECMNRLAAYTKQTPPASLADLQKKTVRFTQTIDADDILNLPPQL
ncbi:MAG: threonine synthase [Oscillospiraceae bacterium]